MIDRTGRNRRNGATVRAMKPPAYERLEPSRETQELWLAALARFALDHVEALADGPAAGPIGAEGARIADSVSRAIGEEPLDGSIDEVVRLLDRASRASLTAPGPGYFA